MDELKNKKENLISKIDESESVINDLFDRKYISDDSYEIIYSYNQSLTHMLIINIKQDYFSIKYNIKDDSMINIDHTFKSNRKDVIDYISSKSDEIAERV